MKTLFKALILLSTTFVVACGGGGGGGGTPGGAEAVLRLYPPVASIGIPVGSSGSTGVEVRGGKAPYTITTSDAGVNVGLTSDNKIAVRGVKEGASEVVIYDSSLPVQTVKISIEAKAVAITSNVGEAINVAIGESRQVNLRGGVAPYTVVSSDSSVVIASISESVVTLVGQPKGGAAKVRVTDSVGTTFELSVTVEAVPTPVLALSPATVTGTVGGSNTIAVSGGKAPYTVASSNTSVASASLSGSSITVSLLAAGSATVSVTDSTGAVVTSAITVTAAATPAPAINVTPADQSVADNNSAEVTYLIAGGDAPYSVLLSPADAVVHLATIDNTVTPPVLSLSVKAGQTRCVPLGDPDKVLSVDVYDAKLVKKTVTLTITNVVGAGAC